MQETQVQSLGQEVPLDKEMATHSSILAWEIPRTEEPGGPQSTASQRVGHDWARVCSHTGLLVAHTEWLVCFKSVPIPLGRLQSLVLRFMIWERKSKAITGQQALLPHRQANPAWQPALRNGMGNAGPRLLATAVMEARSGGGPSPECRQRVQGRGFDLALSLTGQKGGAETWGWCLSFWLDHLRMSHNKYI